jgi:hypothetical protein
MKSKVCALIAISVLIVFMAWQCFTWPVAEMGGRWVKAEYIEAELASSVPVERPPMPAEVVFRGITCAASLLLGVVLMRVLRSRKAG